MPSPCKQLLKSRCFAIALSCGLFLFSNLALAQEGELVKPIRGIISLEDAKTGKIALKESEQSYRILLLHEDVKGLMDIREQANEQTVSTFLSRRFGQNLESEWVSPSSLLIVGEIYEGKGTTTVLGVYSIDKGLTVIRKMAGERAGTIRITRISPSSVIAHAVEGESYAFERDEIHTLRSDREVNSYLAAREGGYIEACQKLPGKWRYNRQFGSAGHPACELPYFSEELNSSRIKYRKIDNFSRVEDYPLSIRVTPSFKFNTYVNQLEKPRKEAVLRQGILYSKHFEGIVLKEKRGQPPSVTFNGRNEIPTKIGTILEDMLDLSSSNSVFFNKTPQALWLKTESNKEYLMHHNNIVLWVPETVSPDGCNLLISEYQLSREDSIQAQADMKIVQLCKLRLE